MKRILLISLILTLSIKSSLAQSTKKLQDNWWQPFGYIGEVERGGNTAFISGSFTYVGPMNAYGAEISLNDMEPAISFAKPNDIVTSAISDGNNGWYIAGIFTSVSGQARSGLARINSNGTLNPWNPSPNGKVRCLSLNNGIVYVGGDFTQVGSEARSRICAIDTLGNILQWNPIANSDVYAITSTDNKIIVGGAFTNIGGQSRNRIAELDIVSGLATAWNPNANANINCILVVKNKVYVGGNFTSIGGQSRNRIACLDITSGAASIFNPDANNLINCMYMSDGVLYVGGGFTTMKSSVRKLFAMLDTASVGAVLSTNVGLATYGGTAVYSISEGNGVIYVGGDFQAPSIGGLVVITKTGIMLPNETPALNSNHTIYSIVANNEKMFFGGDFKSIGGLKQDKIVAIDLITGRAKRDWKIPTITGFISGMTLHDSLLYIGGDFTGFRTNLAAVNIRTGLPASLNIAGINDGVYKMIYNDGKLYILGSFTAINSMSRRTIAVINLATNDVDAFTLAMNFGNVNDIEISGDTLWVVGSFTSISGQNRNNIAAVNKTTGLPYSWNCNVNNTIYDIEMKDSLIYIGGIFTNVGGITRNNLAAINKNTATTNSWNPNASGSVSILKILGPDIYVAGNFKTINAQPKKFLAAFSLKGDSMISTPIVNSDINDIYIDDDITIYGGNFDSIAGKPMNKLATYLNTCKTFVNSSYRSPICQGDTVSLYTKEGVEYTYQWMRNGNEIVNAKSNKYKTVESGTYKVLVTNTELNCSDTSENIIININPRTYAYLTPSTDTAFCLGSPFKLTVDSNATVAAIQWYRNNTILSLGKTSIANVNGNGAYKAVLTNIFGCVDSSKNVNVTRNSVPSKPGFRYYKGTVICGMDSLLISSSGAKKNDLSYQWMHNGVVIPFATDTFFYASDSGKYSVKVQNVYGCSDSGYTTLSKGEQPNVQILSSAGDNICVGMSTLFYYQDSIVKPLANYTWIKNGYSIGGNKPSINRSDIGTYSLFGKTTEGCSDTSNTISLSVNPIPGTFNITGPANVLINNTYAYSVPNITGSKFNWSITKGIQQNGDSTFSAGIQWTGTGNGNIKVIQTSSKGCVGMPVNKTIVIEQPILILDESQVIFNENPLPFGVKVTSNTSWTVTVEDSWLQVSTNSGSGTQFVTLSVPGVHIGSKRTTSVIFKTETITRSLPVIQSGLVGLKEASVLGNIVVYPNPTNGEFVVKNNELRDIKFTVLDLLGKQLIPENSVKTGEEFLVNTNLKKGVYLLLIKDKENSYSTKLIITD